MTSSPVVPCRSSPYGEPGVVLDPGDVVVLAVHPVVRVPVLVDGDRLADVGVAERVDVGPAVEDVGARVRVQGVVAALALDHVVAAPALEVVRTVAAQQGVVPVAGAGACRRRAALDALDVAGEVLVLAGDAVVGAAVERGDHAVLSGRGRLPADGCVVVVVFGAGDREDPRCPR